MAEVEIRDLTADAAPAATDFLLKQAAAGGAGSTKKSTIAQVVGATAPQAHAASHQDGGSDELPVDSLAEAAAPGNDVSQALRPDGAGGVGFSDVAHADLTGVGFDDHKTITTTSTTDGVAKTIETIAVADDTVVEIVADIVGRRTDSADRIGGHIRATVFREAAGGVVVEGTSKDFAASQAQYGLDIVGSGNNALIQVSGRTAHSLNWRSVSKVNSVS